MDGYMNPVRSQVGFLAVAIVLALAAVCAFPAVGRSDTADGPLELAHLTCDHLDLTSMAVTAKLAPKTAKKEERPQSIPKAVGELADGHKVYLVAKKLVTNAQPGVTYKVYLDLPSNASPEVAAKYHVGTVNFFNATAAPNSDRFESFDVTPLLKSLAKEGKLDEVVTVTVIPNGSPVTDSKPQIGELALIVR